MKKRSKEEWLTLIEAHKVSGQTQAQFCKENDICPRYFSLRKKQLSNGTENNGFVKVRHTVPASQGKSLTLRTPHAEITIHQSLTPQDIASLVKALA